MSEPHKNGKQPAGEKRAKPSSNKPSASKPLPGPVPNDPTVFAFLIELIVCGGNASEAARRVGWRADKGRRILADYPGLRDLAMQAVGRMADSRLAEWVEMHAEARDTVRQLMRGAEDERVRLEAAREVIQRVEGKVTQPVRDDTPQVSLDSVVMRFVASLHLTRRMTIAEAMAYADRHPDEVDAWGRAQGLLTPGARP